ncbi:TetR/AcrR family transcriptional regulator [Caulobacter sp. UNC358MFTsu5.1]|uniref:TetR/AcrR family transcriptional regulator n=1 Tax=Caulobacter sp. UNC358MFTsu5.1 TaxID=1449049 RepID=UPI0004A74261|nr:TetR/AcrR family transcriptional regulator [Caulobacter sp. UNC358MFTsu5.1]
MGRISNRENILAAGLRVMFKKGFAGAGVRDIVADAGAPQGSFTNHFGSKEAFAGEVLDLYFEHVRSLVGQALDDQTLPPRERLGRYLDLITDRLAADGYVRGCLIGDLSLETAQTSEALRGRLAAIYREWLVPFTACLAQAQQDGSIARRFSPDDLAEFLIASWQGAILRMKVERSREPLDRFKRIAFETVFTRGDRND